MLPDSVILVLLVIAIIGVGFAIDDWLNPPITPTEEKAADHDHAEH